MRYLHTMVRVADLEKSMHFYRDLMGLKETRRIENEKGPVHAWSSWLHQTTPDAPVELTFNWDPETYSGGRNFGHLAYEVDDIYAFCKHLQDEGVTINRPPRDGRMAFVKSPDGISIELLQKGDAKEPAEPWKSAENTGSW